MFLIGANNEDLDDAFHRYQTCLLEIKTKLTKGLYELATSDWYYDFTDHRCPHDSWLDGVNFTSRVSGERSEIRLLDIELKLLGAYHDLFLFFTYVNVKSYVLSDWNLELGHKDWIRDEFRLSEKGFVLHEILWAGPDDKTRWVIECEDIHFRTVSV